MADNEPDPNENDDGTDDGNDDGNQPDPVEEAQTALADAKKEIRSLRGKLAAASRSAKTPPKPEPKKDDDGPSERERELEASLEKQQQRVRELTAETQAGKLGFRDPDVAVRLLDWELIASPDDPKEVNRALAELAEDRPYLVTDPNEDDTGANTGTGRNRAPTMNDLIRGSLGRRR